MILKVRLFSHQLLIVMLLVFFAPVPAAQSQDTDGIEGLDPDIEETLPTAPAQDVVFEKVTFLKLLRAGGWAMWPLAAFSIAVVALALYNISVLRTQEFCPPALVKQLHRDMSAFQVRTAVETARDHPSYLGRMLGRSLPAMDPDDKETLGREQIHEAISEFAERTNGQYMLWVNYFSILAQASPMLGLLGTVSGMIKAFSTMGREGMGDPTRLAEHISEALVTTACGLIIALPALFCYFVFRNHLIRLIGRCVEIADELLDASLESLNPGFRQSRLPNGLNDE